MSKAKITLLLIFLSIPYKYLIAAENSYVAWHDNHGNFYTLENKLVGKAVYTGYVEIFGERERTQLSRVEKFWITEECNVVITLNNEEVTFGKISMKDFKY